jgi:hypothetical protein
LCTESPPNSTYSAWHERLHSTSEREFGLLPRCADSVL